MRDEQIKSTFWFHIILFLILYVSNFLFYSNKKLNKIEEICLKYIFKNVWSKNAILCNSIKNNDFKWIRTYYNLIKNKFNSYRNSRNSKLI